MSDRELLDELADGVYALDEDRVRHAAEKTVAKGDDALDAVSNGLTPGMERVSQAYETGRYFIPELLVAADALYAGMDVLRPHIQADTAARKAVIVVAVVAVELAAAKVFLDCL